MSFVVTLTDVRPSPRFDGNPWVTARIEEAPTIDGAWALIDSIDLAPLDVDPSKPREHSLTTANAQIAGGWYRVTFVDGDGNTETAPVARTQDGSLPPTPDDVRERSRFLKRALPGEPFDEGVEADLAAAVAEATAWVQTITYRILDPLLVMPDVPLEPVPLGMVPLAVRAVRLVTERGIVLADPDFVEEAAQGKRLRGFTAGPYSESYFAPGDLHVRAHVQGRPQMDTEPAIDQVLWALATEDARLQWIAYATGQHVPAAAVTEFDHRRWPGSYGVSSFGRGVGVGGRFGPDGF